MSHPPETSLELAAEIRKVLNIAIYDLESEEEWHKIAALIEAWVRDQRDTACARCNEMKECLSIGTGFAGEHEPLCADCIFEERTQLETAIEQLKGATHGQDEAPSAAASANSKPGEA